MKNILVAALLSTFVPAALAASDRESVPSRWQPVEIRYSYTGFTTAYQCDAFETKLRRILGTLGAHPNTKVQASGCIPGRPERNFFVTITTARPVPVTEPVDRNAESRQELLQRLGVADATLSEQFAAAWQTVDLSRERQLDLQPGDCELMDGLRREVLPRLSVKIVSDRVRCMPNQLDVRTPELVVSALVRVDADAPAASR
jgi:hypothetical protein